MVKTSQKFLATPCTTVLQARPHGALVHQRTLSSVRLLPTGLSTCTACNAASTTTQLASSTKPPADPSTPGSSSTPGNSNTKSKTSSSGINKGSGGGGGGGGNGGDPGDRPPPFANLTTQQKVLAGHAASTGAMGTLAIGCARALDINLFAMFDWGFNWWFVLALLIPLQASYQDLCFITSFLWLGALLAPFLTSFTLLTHPPMPSS
jgi:hypothetical protein